MLYQRCDRTGTLEPEPDFYRTSSMSPMSNCISTVRVRLVENTLCTAVSAVPITLQRPRPGLFRPLLCLRCPTHSPHTYIYIYTTLQLPEPVLLRTPSVSPMSNYASAIKARLVQTSVSPMFNYTSTIKARLVQTSVSDVQLSGPALFRPLCLRCSTTLQLSRPGLFRPLSPMFNYTSTIRASLVQTSVSPMSNHTSTI